MSDTTTKVDILPGIKLTPQMLLAQVLGDADDLRDVIIVTVDRERSPGDDEYMAVCHTGVRPNDFALASVLLAREVHRIADRQST
jgi:hypothetical protein